MVVKCRIMEIIRSYPSLVNSSCLAVSRSGKTNCSTILREPARGAIAGMSDDGGRLIVEIIVGSSDTG